MKKNHPVQRHNYGLEEGLGISGRLEDRVLGVGGKSGDSMIGSRLEQIDKSSTAPLGTS